MEKLFLLDPACQCVSCLGSPNASEIITSTCKRHFHGVCFTANESNFICRQSFLKVWHSPSVKCNFQWNCDCCQTIIEEREVCKMEDRLDKLTNLVTTLSNELVSTRQTIGQELAFVKSSLVPHCMLLIILMIQLEVVVMSPKLCHLPGQTRKS